MNYGCKVTQRAFYNSLRSPFDNTAGEVFVYEYLDFSTQLDLDLIGEKSPTSSGTFTRSPTLLSSSFLFSHLSI